MKEYNADRWGFLWLQETPFILISFLPVAVAMELLPTMLAAFYVCKDEEKERETWEELNEFPEGHKSIWVR